MQGEGNYFLRRLAAILDLTTTPISSSSSPFIIISFRKRERYFFSSCDFFAQPPFDTEAKATLTSFAAAASSPVKWTSDNDKLLTRYMSRQKCDFVRDIKIHSVNPV
jgi:hypothetical protein